VFLTDEAAQAAFKWISDRFDEGRSVYFTTYLKCYRVTPKRRDMVRLRGRCIEMQSGRQWLDCSSTRITARFD